MQNGQYKQHEQNGGTKAPLSFLKDLAEKGQLASSYVFHGQDQSAILDQTFLLAAYALMKRPQNPYGWPFETTMKFIQQKTHPNFFFLAPSEKGKDILIEETKALASFLQNTPTISGWRFIIISEAHRMNTFACNFLLKNIEEMPGKTTLVMIAPGLASIKTTILSRSQKVFFPASVPTLQEAQEKLDRDPQGRSVLAMIQNSLQKKNIDSKQIELIAGCQESIELLKKLTLIYLHHHVLEGPAFYTKKYETLLHFFNQSEGKSLSANSFVQNVAYLLGE